MKNGMKKWMVAAIFAMIVSIQANANVRSKTIIVDFPSDLPELAQGPIGAMYLHHISVSSPSPLAAVKGVIQRVDRPGTGTIFLLNEEGITVVRSLAAEEEHQTEIWEKEGN